MPRTRRSGAVPLAGLTAAQALRRPGTLDPGRSVLVNGASGGVGSFAVPLAKLLGASHVTAVCSTRNVEAASARGADRVVDYTREDVRDLGDTFDVFFDNAGTLSLRDCRRMLVDLLLHCPCGISHRIVLDSVHVFR